MRHREKAKLRWREEREKQRAGTEKTAMSETETEAEDNLQIAWSGGREYRVFNIKSDNGNGTFHKVDLAEGTCTCEYSEYNSHEENDKACKHISKATMTAPSHPETDDQITMAHIELVQSALSIMEDARETVRNAEIADSHAKRAGAMSRAAEAEATRAENAGGSEDKMEKLENALESDGFEVHFMSQEGSELHFSLGHDRFDHLKDVTSGCDYVKYDGDNNILEVGDVNRYIEENL